MLLVSKPGKCYRLLHYPYVSVSGYHTPIVHLKLFVFIVNTITADV